MAIKSDFHLHSNHSSDSDSSMESMILRGIELGLESMCFTEHHDIDFPEVSKETGEAMFNLNTDSYLYELLGLRYKYEDKIKILFGVEIGMQPHLRRELALYAKAYEFDYIIGSTHLVGRIDPYYESYFEGKSDEEAYRTYFKEVYENMKIFSNYDVLAHLDYIVRYGKNKDENYSYEKYADVIDPILNKLIDQEKGLEVNTGGLRHGLREANPCTDIIKKYKSLGGEIITIGSDAHRPSDIAIEFDRASEILKECGYKYYTTFEKRTVEMHKLV